MKKFSFTYRTSFVRDNAKQHLFSVSVNAQAYLYRDGSVRSVDIDEVFYNGEKVPDNFLWIVNETLYNEIQEAAMTQANKLWYAVNTTPEPVI